MNKVKPPTTAQILDVVALAEDIPFHKLMRGQLGTVVEILSSGAFEVEFEISEAEQHLLLTLRDDQIIVLRAQISEDTLH